VINFSLAVTLRAAMFTNNYFFFTGDPGIIPPA
jgi:hypothetical protein